MFRGQRHQQKERAINEPLIAQQFIFVDNNYPELFYWGNICDMRGCEIEGGYPKRCYVGDWINGLWQDRYKDKRPGDTIEVETSMGKETWDVVKAPSNWWDACWQESEKNRESRHHFDTAMDICDVFMLGHGDCIIGSIEIDDIKYPVLRWGVVKLHLDDSDLLYLVPLMESDPYGRITDYLFEELGENLSDYTVFIEDETAQDHMVAFTGNGVWAHRNDLLGVDREMERGQIVKPCRQSLARLVSPS